MASSSTTKADEDEEDDLFAIKPRTVKKSKEPNPFSFKEFLSKPDDEGLPPELPAILTDTLPDISPTNVSKIGAAAVASADAKADSTNPFSFKQFLQSSELPIDSLPSVTSPGTIKIAPLPPTPPQPSRKKTPKAAAALPEISNSSLEHLLPDCVTDKSDDDFDSPKTAARAKPKRIDSFKAVEDELPLPDDAGLPTLDDLPNLDEPAFGSHDHNVKLENQSLRAQIESNQKQLNDQAVLIKKLEKQIKTLKDREETENKALEMMVQQVEQNLVKTTERAVKSEQHAEALKTEIKQLKTHVLTLTTENTQLKLQKSAANNESQQKRLEDYAGQLEFASNTAETSLKQLLSGLESLRLISSSLKTFGKITEVSSNQD